MSEGIIVPTVLTVMAAFGLTRGTYRLLIGNRSVTWQFALALTGLGLGLRPAIHGNRLGYVLVAVGALAALPLLADAVHWLGDICRRLGTVRRRTPSHRRDEAASDDTALAGAITELDRAAALTPARRGTGPGSHVRSTGRRAAGRDRRT